MHSLEKSDFTEFSVDTKICVVPHYSISFSDIIKKHESANANLSIFHHYTLYQYLVTFTTKMQSE